MAEYEKYSSSLKKKRSRTCCYSQFSSKLWRCMPGRSFLQFVCTTWSNVRSVGQQQIKWSRRYYRIIAVFRVSNLRRFFWKQFRYCEWRVVIGYTPCQVTRSVTNHYTRHLQISLSLKWVVCETKPLILSLSVCSQVHRPTNTLKMSSFVRQNHSF